MVSAYFQRKDKCVRRIYYVSFAIKTPRFLISETGFLIGPKIRLS